MEINHDKDIFKIHRYQKIQTEELSKREKEIYYLYKVENLKFKEIVSTLSLLTEKEQIRVKNAVKKFEGE
ncbi:hypothetical protein [Guptibacillus spartinae]|uniref:hypothetical protein n=1 Tax=Guptibacillus spartinae TaxID=3025679 RepID=UPI00235E2AFD|nr:hypothetical protein [Pseudalkalibacillus spartinae]